MRFLLGWACKNKSNSCCFEYMWKPLQTRESFCPSLSPGEMLHTCSLSGNAANNRSLKDVLKNPTTKQWHFHYWQLETDYQHRTHSGRGELGESQPCLTFYWKLELQSVFWFHFYFCFILIRNCTMKAFWLLLPLCLPGWSGHHCSFWTILKMSVPWWIILWPFQLASENCLTVIPQCCSLVHS